MNEEKIGWLIIGLGCFIFGRLCAHRLVESMRTGTKSFPDYFVEIFLSILLGLGTLGFVFLIGVVLVWVVS